MLSFGALFQHSVLMRAGGAVCGLVAFLVVALALSRGAYLGAALGVIVLLAMLPQARRTFLFALIPLLAMAGFLVTLAHDVPQIGVFLDRLKSFSAPEANPYDARPRIWAEAFRQIELHPFLGTGPGNFPVAALGPGSKAADAVPTHAHNVVLTVAAEVGVAGAAIMVFLTIVWAMLLFRTARRLDDGSDAGLVAGLSASLAAFVGQGVVDVTLRSPTLLLLLSACLGLSLATTQVSVGRGLYSSRLTEEASAWRR
jgi:O-antigen ligase